jgi:hypothetical protein
MYDTNVKQNAWGDKRLDSSSRKLTREHTNQEQTPKIPIEYHRKDIN